ncbi:MAG TPA: hypothetical protein VJW55_06790, partial [Candidatus Angelobacter sp.]|nr:hypothetical protein [Candidatus Angelobacter sp.]
PKPANETPTPAEQVAVASNEATSPLPPDKPGQVHMQVDTPFVFSARSGRSSAMAKVQFSTLPNVYFVQEKVDPVVLVEKQPEVSLEAKAAASKPEEKPRKEKRGFMGRMKGFFGSLFHR